MPMRDPDAALIAVFKTMAVKNPSATASSGRPVFEDMDVCEIRAPGSKNVSVFPATAVSHWTVDPESGEQVQVTYAERFAHQFQQFKSHTAQTKAGTPLAEVAFLTEARRAELRAFNIYTVEALAAIDGLELKNLGPNGRELKNKAMDYLAEADLKAPNMQLMAELEALRARTVLLEEDNKHLMAKVGGQTKSDVNPDTNFEAMTLDQLKSYIETNTGFPPQGAVNRKTLIRMARSAAEDRAA